MKEPLFFLKILQKCSNYLFEERKEALVLKVHHMFTKNGTEFYCLLDDNYNVIEPVFKFLKNRVTRKYSINTVYNQCLHLKLYFSWLQKQNLTYIEAITKTENASAYDNLINFRLYATYENYDEKVIPIGGYQQIRSTATVNQIMITVLTFYAYLAITEDNIEELNVYQQKATLKHFHSFLREMFMKKTSAKSNLLIAKVDAPKLEHISIEQFNACWDACKCRRDRIIIGIAFYGGCRVSEIIGLNLYDLRDIYKNVIYISKREDPNNPDAFVKNDSEGITVVPDMVRDEIIAYLNEDLQGIDTDYVIINFVGTRKFQPMRRNTIDEMVHKLGKKVGISNLHMHMFRHGCAVFMLENGIDLMTISDKLRHKNVGTTTKFYAKFDEKAKSSVMKELAEKTNQRLEPLGINTDDLIEFLKEGDCDE